MKSKFFPSKPDVNPTIYAYEDTSLQYRGLLKVGYTGIDAKRRIAEQYPVLRPGALPYKIQLEERAVRPDGTAFSDHDVHRQLKRMGVKNEEGEWFRCTPKQVLAAIVAVRDRAENIESRTQTFGLRPEQKAAVMKTAAYLRSCKKDDKKATPHFLWNAKMRFGKTFASYKLAKEMGWKKILVLTFKPAVQGAWSDDLKSHIDFEGWQFISPGGDLSYEDADKKRPIVCFGSFQDYLGKNKSTGGIKTKNEWVHATHWDCVVLDEYHYGAWRESARELFTAEDGKEAEFGQGEGIEDFDEGIMPITTEAYLYLSGTPFRAIASGEFIEEQIFNWTYSDEQKAKSEWKGKENPYATLPRMVLMTYQLPEAITQVAFEGEFNEFDLNVFFGATGKGGTARFNFEDQVQKWLDIIRGALPAATRDSLKLGAQKPPMPFAHSPLLRLLSHTFWFMPSVASCHAMKNLLGQRQNNFFNTYKIVVAAGAEAGIGVDALAPVEAAMEDPLNNKSITLSCGKLTTGVTIKPWTGIFMLRNCTSPETYFQAAFRVQSPWVIRNPDNTSPNKELIIKDECYVFDFAPNRALRQIAEYSCRLDVNESNPEKKVAEFINFLPVLAYDGSSMKQIDAAGILDMAMSGTTATLLARRWESALLVNVDNNTLQRLMDNKEAMDALMSIEGFRSLNKDIETIINKSDAVKKAKKKANDDVISTKKKKELTDAEKEYKSLRKEIQEKLIKFATRIPIFMYLSDYRERTLKDVITQLEPGLFKKVTGLTVRDFNLLVSLGVFNSALMNDAIYKFKRYEDSSLVYAGINKHEGEEVGLFDTVISSKEFNAPLVNEDE
jgi:hypothetical protein